MANSVVYLGFKISQLTDESLETKNPNTAAVGWSCIVKTFLIGLSLGPTAKV